MAKKIENKLGNLNVTIKDIDSFRKWQRLKTAQKAFELKLENLAAKAGLPKAKQFKKDCKGYLADKSGNPVAKFSVYSMPERTMPACKVCRIS